MKHLLLFFSFSASYYTLAQVPRPDHVIITIFENRSFGYLVGNTTKAPFINSLLTDTNVALFTQSYALTNPSQPNYLMLYSGSNQGVTIDSVPDGLPFTTCNLGANLIANGFTIRSYCESMPSVGFTGKYSGSYLKRHNPVAYWQGTGQNNTPPEINRPYSDFPSDYSLLPDVSFVIANIDHSMHDGSTEAGDQWFENELKSYINWSRQNNSLLIFTFDEDDEQSNDHILTFFYGPMVKGGSYSDKIDHYTILRTLEDMYGIGHCGASANRSAITNVWKNGATGISNILNGQDLEIFPSPASENLTVRIKSSAGNSVTDLTITDYTGRKVAEHKLTVNEGGSIHTIPVSTLADGIYILEVQGFREKFVVGR